MSMEELQSLLSTVLGSFQTQTAYAVYTSVFVAFSFLAFGFGLLREYRHWEIQKRLRTLAKSTQSTPDEPEIENFSDRVIKPLGRSFLAKLGSMTPGGNMDLLRQQLAMAGNPNNLVVIDLLGLKMLGGIFLGILCGIYVFRIAEMPTLSAVGLCVSTAVVGTYLPNYWLKGKIKKRREEMRRSLPNALDMLTTMVDAGLGFEMALLRLSDRWHNALTQEFERMVNEMNMGVRRVDALRNLAERNDVDELRTFVAVLIQADSLGISVSDILHTQSEQMRMRRRQWVQEQANKLPIKMLPIIAMFILPALFAIILGPAIPVLIESFSGF